jgi:RimJ/RimL family protein N-acetyltransferase
MTHPVWPLFDLVVRTPRLELRGITDEVALELAQLAAQGIHDPGFMPFAFEWTDVEPPQLLVNTMQFYWRCRAETSAASWNLNFAVVVDGEVVGTTGMMANHFPTLRVFETGSWLGRRFQGRGIGTEMRLATLQLGFEGFDARLATTSAFVDNPPSLGVTRTLGYTSQGETTKLRRGEPAVSKHFDMTREYWAEHLRRDDIELIGVEPVRDLLGIS